MKPIQLSSEQIEELQTQGRVVEGGRVIRAEAAEGPRKFFGDIAEAVSKGEHVETFTEQERFCVVKEKRDGNIWFSGVNIGGVWIIGRFFQKTVVVEEKEGFTPDETATFAKATFYEGDPDITPEQSDEFRGTLTDWMYDIGTDNEVDTARYDGPHHDFEYVLDDVFAYYE